MENQDTTLTTPEPISPPPQLFTPFQRENDGLLKNFVYPTTEEGLIDWRGVIPPKYLYVNPQQRARLEKKYGKKVEELDIKNDRLQDGEIVINLAGIKYLLGIRGYSDLDYEIQTSTIEFAAVKCKIRFIGIPETDGKEKNFADNACAHYGNTNSFGKNYLLEIATNRAFCRCVRNFLNISIVSKDELGEPEIASSPQNNAPDLLLPSLKERMKKYGYTFDQIKSRIAKEFKNPEVEKWNKIEDMSSELIVWSIERMDQKAAKEKAEKEKGN